MPPVPHRTELRTTLSLATMRGMIGVLARTGNPAARLLNHRPLPDPYPDYERLRAKGPLIRSPLGVYFTVTHEVVAPVLRNGEDWNVVALEDLSPVRWEDGMVHPVDHSLLVFNPPDHTRLRRLVAPWFTPRAVARWEDTIRGTVAGFLDRLAEHDQFDLVTEFATRVPVRVICDMLGVADARYPDFVRWGSALGGTLDGVQSLTEWRAVRVTVAEMTAFFTDLIERRRADPGEDLVSELVGNDDLTAQDLIALVGLLLVAGFETTRGLIGNAMLALLDNPEQADALRADPGLASGAVEETLRYDSPVQYTMRGARHEVELAGRTLPKDALVVTLIGGANRDPAVFADPARFDITRANAREHLSFSGRVHYCLGAGLARLEGEIALRELMERFPNLHAAAPSRRRTMRLLRGMESMPVNTGARVTVIR